MRNHNHEQGGVSIFIVIFTALLVTIVTASFAQLMVRNQQQATANDLSQSAYDSALAGVEDAKRALVRLQQCEKSGDDDCATRIRDAFDATQGCDALADAGVVDTTDFQDDGEVTVGDAKQNQAYTCVKVQLDTPDFKDDSLAPGIPVVVPLKSKSSFEKVRISWFTKTDLDKASSYSGDVPVTFPTGFGGGALPLPQNGDEDGGWSTYAPALLRTQLIQFKKGDIDLDAFNAKDTPNARTLFLYPQNYNTNDPQALSFTTDTRRSNTHQNEPMPASCNTDFDKFNGYACQVELTLPALSGGGTREAYLQLQTYYQQYTSFKIELVSNSGTNVDLNEVQPRVDSTGRASSLFRRVEANVSLRNDGISLPYPDAALSVDGDLCKNFFITDESSEYRMHDSGNSGCS